MSGLACGVRAGNADSLAVLLKCVTTSASQHSVLRLPVEVKLLIAEYAGHTHAYVKEIPPGPRDNGEFSYVCWICGHVSCA